jgi:O-antigen ligase
MKFSLSAFTDGQSPVEILLVLSLALGLLFSQISISAVQIFLAFGLIGWIILLGQKKIRFSFPDFFWPLLVYAALSLLSCALSVNPGISFKDDRKLVLFLLVPIVYAALKRKKEMSFLSAALLASGFINSAYAIGYYFLKAYPGERVKGFMGHYMTQAGLLVLFGSFALGMIFFRRDKTRILWGLALVLSGVALVLTMTRSAWIGLAVALCVILFLWKPKALVLVPVIGGLVFFASPRPIKDRALSIFSSTEFSNMARVEYFRAGIKIIKDYPLHGTGPKTVDMVFQESKYGLDELAKKNVHLHNNLLQIAAERGIPALLAWLAFVAMAFIALIKLVKEKDADYRAPAAGALAALAAFFAAGFFEYNFGDSEVLTLLLFIVTMPFALARIKNED